METRNTSSTVFNFGEHHGAVGYLIGGLGNGLACMFRMMNEVRIGFGFNAAADATRAYLFVRWRYRFLWWQAARCALLPRMGAAAGTASVHTAGG
jgi:hypothetical protein